MTNFTNKTKANKQLEYTYVLYMIFSSYFHKCTCMTTTMEKKLFLHYKDMPTPKQECFEARAIKAAEKTFRNCKKVLEASDCKAYIFRSKDQFLLRFYTGFEEVRVDVDAQGKVKTTVIYKNIRRMKPNRTSEKREGNTLGAKKCA